MGAPKQKWTPEEEAALRAGVEKYGPGKWRAIQKDPEFGPCLVTRSNVDLKDKWRNMNVGSSGHGSRDKSLKAIRHIAGKADESLPLPLAIMPAELSADDTHGVVDTLVSSDSSKDRKTLGPRYTELVVNAIHESKEPNGCSTAAIATFIEAHHSLPSNFRRLLSSKLREMVNQGNLIKSRQNFKVNTAEPASKAGVLLQDGDDGNQNAEFYRDSGKRMRGHVKGNELNSTDRLLSDVSDAKQAFRATRSHMKKLRGESGRRRARLDVDFARSKLKTAEEAARAAALAVAEAEAAATAAEKAAKEAEAAEAEAEAAEIAAEIAALAARPPKKVRTAAFPAEEVAVAV